MQMNKRSIAALCLALLLMVPQSAMAAENGKITAASHSTLPGKTITVPITITGNPGFTNFGIALEYEGDKLILQDIQTAAGEAPYLCSARVSSNLAWKDAEGKSRGYVAAAPTQKVTEDGILFVATFALDPGFVGTTEITPRVYDLRSYNGESGFADVSVDVQPAKITAIVRGDINKDGVIEYDDVMAAYGAATGELTLTEEQLEIGNMDGIGLIEMADAEAIYQIYIGGE